MSSFSPTVPSDESLDGLLNMLSTPIFRISLDSNILAMNTKAQELTGYSAQDAVGKSFINFMKPTTQVSIQAAIQEALQGKDRVAFAFFDAKFGNQIDMIMNVTCWPKKSCTSSCIIFASDVSDLRQSMAPHYSVAGPDNLHMQRLFETFTAPIFGLDKNGFVTMWNKKACSLTGYPREEAIGRPLVRDFVAPEFQEQVQASVTNHAQADVVEFTLLSKNGQGIEIMMNMTTISDDDGQFCGMLGIGQEITQLRETIKNTAKMSDDLARVIDTANAPIFGIDTKGLVTEWNQKAAMLTGWDSLYAMGQPLVERFISSDYRQQVDTVLNMALQGYDTANFVFPLYTKDGQRREISLNATARRGPSGEIIGVIGVGQDITELNQISAQHQRLASDWQRLIETANAPIFGVDVEGRVKEWNAKAAEITGYSKEETFRQPLVQKFITPEHQDRVQQVLSQAIFGTETANFEFPLSTKHGKQIDILLNATTRRDDTGAVVGVFGIGQDVTDLKVLLRENARIADNLTRMINTANAPIFGIDTQGNVDEWNAKAAEITGYSKDEALGRPLVRDFITSEHQSRVQQVLCDARNGTETANFEFPLATKDGKQIDILLNATAKCDETGAVVGVFGVGQDITNFRAALTENSRIADDLTRLIDTANAPILGIDREGRVTEWNQKAAQIIGYERSEAIGARFDSFITEGFRQEVRDVLNKALCGTDTANFTFPMFSKDGRRREISLNATARRGGDNEIIGVIGVGQDVTDLKQISAQNQRMAADWQRLIETANAPIFGVDIYGNVNEWNAKVAEVTGYLKAEVVRRPLVKDFITPDHRDRVQQVMTSACNGRETANFEFPLATKTGKQIDILFNATPRRDEKGAVVGVFGVGQDITNLRSALTETKRIADDLTRLIDTANAPIFGIDPLGNVNEWNQKATAISGWGRKESIGKPFVSTFITSGFQKEVSQVLSQALHGNDTANFTFPLFTKDGRRREISLNATARRGMDGEITGVIGVGQDITDFEQSRLEQQRIAEDYERLIDTANAPIFGVSIDGKVTEWNRKAAELIGYSSEESLGKHMVRTFITPEYQEKVQGVLEEACRGQDTANFEFPLVNKTGKQVDIMLNATARRNAAGSVTGVVMVGQDVTDIRRAINEAKFTADDLQRLIDTANAPIFGVDTKGAINEWNQKMATITGFSKREVVGNSFVVDLIMLQHKADVKKALDMALSGQETANYEIPILTKDQHLAYILLNTTTRRGSSGEITGVICVGQDFTEHKELMENYSRMANDWLRMVDSANAPIFAINTDKTISVWNNKCIDLLGYSKEEAENMNLVEKLVTKDYRERVHASLEQACSGLDVADVEVPMVTKDGSVIHLLLGATPRRDGQGKIEGAFSVGQNITELRASTEQTQMLAEDLARLIDSANAPIVGVDSKGLITEWNRMFYKITGYDKESVLGKPLLQTFIHEKQHAEVNEVMSRALSGEDIAAHFEVCMYTNNGQVREISLNATPRIGSNGEISGVIGVGQDVTEVNIQKRELERVADNLRRTVDYANAPIIGVNVQCVINEFNWKAAQLSGFSKQEILGQNLVQQLVSVEKRPSVSFALLQALSGQESSVLEFPLTTKDGGRRELTMNFTALRGVTGDMEGVICVGSDVTELKEMAAQQRFIAEDFERIIRSANAPIIGVNTNGEVNEWNDKAAELSGYSREEAVGKPLVETFVRSDQRSVVSDAIRKACCGIETTNFEFGLIARDSSLVLLLLNAASRTDAWGNIIGMVGVGQDITNLRQAMDEIAASRDEVTKMAEDLRRIIDHANAPILGIDTQGRITEWNQKMAEITEFHKDEMLGKPLIEAFILEEYQVQVARVLNMAMEGVETDNYEFSIKSKSGMRREILLNAATRRGPDGRVTGVIGVGQDITNIRAMTTEKERVAEDLRRLIETANAPIFAVNAEGKVTEWNRKCVELLGYSKQDAMGQPLVRKYIHQVHRKSVRSVLSRALANHEVANFELTFYTREGEQRDILLSATPRWGQENEINGVVCVGQDVTEMKRHRDNAERAASDYSRLINTANAPIFGVDKDACITEWNNWVAVKSGFEKDETRGRRLTNYISRKSKALWLEVLEDALKGNPTETFEVELAPKDPDEQKSVSLLLNATPRINPQGDIIGVTCVGQDITNIKEMEQRKASFMAVVSHELRSPLNGIMGLSSGLVENAVVGSSFHKQLSLIHNCAARLLDMVNNIMDAGSLVQDRKMRFSADNVHLEKIVEEVVVLCQNSADRHGKKLVKEGVRLINEVTELPMITADPYRCTQLVYNLVTNALKFTCEGYVKLLSRVDEANQTVTVTIEDTGIGIAPEKLENIFQPFEQEDNSSTRRFEGLGLGLSICKEVAVKHGGALSVDSEKGKGSQFHVTLPFHMTPPQGPDPEQVIRDEEQLVADADTPPPTPTHMRGPSAMADTDIDELQYEDDYDDQKSQVPQWPSEEGDLLKDNSEDDLDSLSDLPPTDNPVVDSSFKDGTKDGTKDMPLDQLPPKLTESSPTVMSVDGDVECQQMLIHWLAHHGLRVLDLDTSEACVEYFESGKELPQLILLDEHSSKGAASTGGLDVVTHIRKSYSMFDVPIVIVSSRNSTTALARGLNRQCNDWIHKPFDRRELLARVKSILSMRDLVMHTMSQSVRVDTLLEFFPANVVDMITSGQVTAANIREIQDQTQGITSALRDSIEDERAEEEQRVVVEEQRKADSKKAQQEFQELQRKLSRTRKEKEDVESGLAEVQEALEHCKQEQVHAEQALQKLQSELKAQKRLKQQEKQQAASQSSKSSPRVPQVVKRPQANKSVQVDAPPLSAAPAAQAPAPPAAQAPAPPAPLSGQQWGKTNGFAETGTTLDHQVGKLVPEAPRNGDMFTGITLLNAHLELDVRLRERQIQELHAKLRQQTMLAMRMQERCFELERALHHARVDGPAPVCPIP